MPIDPSIALGVRPIEQPNMLAQMGQMMALRQAQQGYESENALKDFYAQGGDTTTAEGRRKLMSTVGLKGADILKKEAETENTRATTSKTKADNIKVNVANSVAALAGVNDLPSYMAWHEANHDAKINPAMADYFKTMGIDPNQSKAHIAEVVAKLGPVAGLEQLKKESMGAVPELFKHITQSEDNRQTNIQSNTNNIRTTGAAMAGHNISRENSIRTDTRTREALTPLAGEKIVNGEKVPAYFGYSPYGNTLDEATIPTVSVGPIANIPTPTNALAPNAPANVNALGMPPAGAPTSPVARPVTAAIPSAAAPSAAMPSAAAPTSVVPGAPNAPAPVRFGPKSTAENLTEAQGKATGFALRAKQASDILDIVGKAGAVQPGVIKRVGESVPLVGEGLGTMLNATQTAPQQQVEQAQRAFVNAILRQESGAAINESEFVNAKKQYFPQPGDSKQVIEQKRLNRETAVKSLEVAAGPGMKQAAPTTGLKVGTVEEGYRFKGGDPANKNNWEKQ